MAEIDNKSGPVLPSTLQHKGFNLRLRYPGWLPDEIRKVDNGSTTGIEQLYVEEVLGAIKLADDSTLRLPFQPPLHETGNSIWILGYPLHEVDDQGNELPPEDWNKFNTWLLEVTRRIRNYNASLYRLRRLHLKAEGNKLEMEMLLTDGGKEWTAGNAESNWKQTVEHLRSILTPKSSDNPFDTCIADMVEVNGYIVSIRAVVEIFIGGSPELLAKIFGPQPGGSSSSHTSINSPFSSSTP